MKLSKGGFPSRWFSPPETIVINGVKQQRAPINGLLNKWGFSLGLFHPYFSGVMGPSKPWWEGCKIGQAPALSRPLWKEWVKFIAAECGACIAIILSFTSNFGLRCSEALCLKREDISIQNDIPKICVTGDTIGNRKSPWGVYASKRLEHLLGIPRKTAVGEGSRMLQEHLGKIFESVNGLTIMVYTCQDQNGHQQKGFS